MAMLLPKGFVVNSPEINSNIQSLDSSPVGDAEIAKLWKVYTTTQRRLKDPTAERLENLWWRIWGSRDKTLKGAIVAKLFIDISDGETFVPLRGPPNRDEGPPSLAMQRRPKPQPAASSTPIMRNNEQNKSGTDNSPSSRERAPMPHPILKKTRGPSTGGPRPTARFISPHDTEDETSPDNSESANSHVVIEPPSPQDPEFEKKFPSTSGRKKPAFVASTKKKRPVIVKRQSSQTSQSSNGSPAQASHFAGTNSSAERTPPTFTAQSRAKTQSRFQENFSPSGSSLKNVHSPKRRVVVRTNSHKNVSPRKRNLTGKGKQKASDESGPSASHGGGDPGPSTTRHRVDSQDNTFEEPESLTLEEEDELRLQTILLEEANARVERRNQLALQMLEQARVETTVKEPRRASGSSAGHGLLSNNARSKSSVSIAPTFAAPTGQLDLGNLGDASSEGMNLSSRSASMGMLDKGKGRDSDDLRRTAMFAKRPIQVVQTSEPEPSSASIGALSRSRSQLTLLLERDRSRGKERSSSKSPTKGNQK